MSILSVPESNFTPGNAFQLNLCHFGETSRSSSTTHVFTFCKLAVETVSEIVLHVNKFVFSQTRSIDHIKELNSVQKSKIVSTRAPTTLTHPQTERNGGHLHLMHQSRPWLRSTTHVIFCERRMTRKISPPSQQTSAPALTEPNRPSCSATN